MCYLSDLESSMSRSLRFGRPISHEFLVSVCRKLAFAIPTVRQIAKVLGPLVKRYSFVENKDWVFSLTYKHTVAIPFTVKVLKESVNLYYQDQIQTEPHGMLTSRNMSA